MINICYKQNNLHENNALQKVRTKNAYNDRKAIVYRWKYTSIVPRGDQTLT